MFKNTLFLKIILVFTLPALGMLYFSSLLVYEKVQMIKEIDNIQKSIKYITATEQLLHSIQRERDYSVSFLGTNKFEEELKEQIIHTRKSYDNYLQTVIHMDVSEKHITLNIKKVQSLFYKLDLLREDITVSNIGMNETFERYSHLNELLLETITTLKPIKFITEFNEKFSNVVNILMAKEYAGMERAYISMLISKHITDEKSTTKLIEIITKQDIFLNKFLLKSEIEEINQFNERVSLSLRNKISEVREEIRTNKVEKSTTVDYWWDISTEKIDALGNVYKFVSIKTSKLATTIENDSYMAQVFSFTFLLISFITLISLFFLLKNITFSEQKNFSIVRKQQEIYKLLNKANKVLLKINNQKVMFTKICKMLSKNSDMSFSFIYKVGKNNQTKLYAVNEPLKDIINSKLQSTSANLKNSLIYKVQTQDKNIILDSFNNETDSAIFDVAKRYNLHSAAAFPIKKFNKLAAVLVIYSNKEKFFDKDLEILFDNMINDMTHALEKIEYEKNRRKQENQLRIASYAFETNEPMIITDSYVRVINSNQAFCNVMGYDKNEIMGKNPSMFKSSTHSKNFYANIWEELEKNSSWSGEIYNKKKNNQILPLRTTITAIKDDKGRVTHYLAQYIDISKEKDREKTLEHQATHDILTGLPNRLLLLDRIERAIVKVVRHNIMSSLIFIDLDNFKQINDTLGHEIGDKLLILVAQKLRETMREEDTIARIGGDEFIILTDNVGTTYPIAKENLQLITNKLLSAINSIEKIDGHINIATPSIGVTIFSDAKLSVNDIIKQADCAMYQAKNEGKNRVSFFSESDSILEPVPN